MVHSAVEQTVPQRITHTWTAGLVPDGLTPRLPFDFEHFDLPDTEGGSQLVVVSGVPGSGKSTVAEAVGRQLGIPVYALDSILGTSTPFGGRHSDRPHEIGAELLTALALRRLASGQSARSSTHPPRIPPSASAGTASPAAPERT